MSGMLRQGGQPTALSPCSLGEIRTEETRHSSRAAANSSGVSVHNICAHVKLSDDSKIWLSCKWQFVRCREAIRSRAED